MGHKVLSVDNDAGKIGSLKKGLTPFFEPELQDFLDKCRKKRLITFSDRISELVAHSEIIFICVGTPPRPDGSADLSAIEHVAHEIAKNLTRYTLIVDKSTVPVITGERVSKIIETQRPRGVPFDVASNPEFLREGTAVYDFFNPDRIVIGVNSARAAELLQELYRPITASLITTDIRSAELIKHASNSFLATKIAYANALSRICDLVGADVKEVTRGVGMDRRIGQAFLNPGLVGGFCLPKDLDAFYHISKRSGYDFKLLQVVKEINEDQKEIVIQKLEEELWNLEKKTVSLLGLSFKPDTDDLRFAPSLDIARKLLERQVHIRAYDPASMSRAKELLGPKVAFAKNAYDCAKGAHALIMMTEWPEFGRLDFKKLKAAMELPVVVDVRNFWDPKSLKQLGFRYRGIGRS